MIDCRRTVVMAGLLALVAGSMTAPLAQAKMAPSGNPQVNNPATQSYNQRLASHAQAEALLQHYGFAQYAPGRWTLEGHEVDLPPAANLTNQNFDAFAEQAGRIADTVAHQRAQAQNPKSNTPMKLPPTTASGGGGGGGGEARPGCEEDCGEGIDRR